MRKAFFLLFPMLMIVFVAANAGAQDIMENCAETVSTASILTHDLTCSGIGLSISAGGSLNCNGYTITFDTGQTGAPGIVIGPLTATTVENCVISGPGPGIVMDGVSGSDVHHNTFLGNNPSIFIASDAAAANNNLVHENTIKDTLGVGIVVSDAVGNGVAGTVIDNNVLTNTAGAGIVLNSLRSPNTVKNNNIIGSNINGIQVSGTTSGVFTGNLVQNSGNVGVLLNNGAAGNAFADNVFDNIANVQIVGVSQTNQWDDGQRGNTWLSPDKMGFSQTCLDQDKNGVCDNPFVIDANNVDRFPLVSAVNPFVSGGTFVLQPGKNETFVTAITDVTMQVKAISTEPVLITVKVAAFSAPNTTTMEVTTSGDVEYSLVSSLEPLAAIASFIALGEPTNTTFAVVGEALGGSADLMIMPLTKGISATATSFAGPGQDKAFPLTVQKSHVGGGEVNRQHVPVNGVLAKAGDMTITASGISATAPFEQIVVDGKDVAKFRPNALVFAPEGRQFVALDEAEGRSCHAETLKLQEDGSGKPVSKMFVKNTKTGVWTCSDGKAVSGSLLMVYDPEIIVEGDVPFVYDTDDHYWTVTTSVAPPDGCSASPSSQSLILDNSTEAVLFSLTCSLDTVAVGQAAHLFAPSAQSGDRAKVVHEARDCTRPGCPPTHVASAIAVAKARGRADGLRGITGHSVLDGAPSGVSDQAIMLVVSFAALVSIAVLAWQEGRR